MVSTRTPVAWSSAAGAGGDVARDADKLECLVPAVEYREHGYSLTQN
ncbi:hypothetical protein ACFWV1_18505 [Streptomyces sp. NPDC058700]